MAELRELSFPYPGDATDVFTLKTERGTGTFDQGTGALLGWTDLTAWEHVSETVYMLHTGHGAAALGLVLGLMALGVPAMGATGVLVWLSGRRGRPRISANQPAGRAGTILLVGSEGGSTWGFAATLHAALTEAGHSVHAAPMSAFAPDRYVRAERIIVLTSTYGDGDAPASAKGFLERLGGSRARARDAAGRARLRRPQLPRLLRLCEGRRGRGRGESLAGAPAARHDRPPVAAGLRALGTGPWPEAGDRTGTGPSAGPAGGRDTHADRRVATMVPKFRRRPRSCALRRRR